MSDDIPKIPIDEFLAKMPSLEKRMQRMLLLQAVADAAEQCLNDSRTAEEPDGSKVFWLAGGHRRIRLADALKALKA